MTVGHNAIIHGATIGNNTLVGMGAVLLSRVKVGHSCVVGAHSLLTRGTEIPDNSLVLGHPAKVVRELTAEEVDAAMQTTVAACTSKLGAVQR